MNNPLTDDEIEFHMAVIQGIFHRFRNEEPMIVLRTAEQAFSGKTEFRPMLMKIASLFAISKILGTPAVTVPLEIFDDLIPFLEEYKARIAKLRADTKSQQTVTE